MEILKSTEQQVKMKQLNNSLAKNRCVAERVSFDGINPNTEFRSSTPLLIGIGGGGREISRGLPFDVLTMILTAEQLRRDAGLGTCYIVCADDAAYTNVGVKEGFTDDKVHRVIQAKKELIQLVVDQLGFSDNFSIFLGSNIQSTIGTGGIEVFNDITDQIRSDYGVGEYFAIEIAQMYSLVGRGKGAVKIGWFNKRISIRNKRTFMDELSFDAFYKVFCSQQGLPDILSCVYVNAGVNLKPGQNDQVVKEPPYTCYDPETRILLNPAENAERKLNPIVNNQNKPANISIRKYYDNLIRLFEDVTGINSRPKGTTTSQRIQLIIDTLFAGRELEARAIWMHGFQE
ncbi:hypothetical protein A3F29_02190 [Candidatus Roizmanbacteria bacterium RIFCSPHIGHO2_12_FULL_33_9]|uniref:Uncharacterized protein n=1 Tax=Candidatus Roizmanbacteria bacterium RIFCSPHIGHO2_12_FULL_33_9 TaxID=1802045 RepID=A0A1F7HIL9_9BACT|nr:MAG: hypothetical protein A3F29_02190 [Candidatus Roizmanbacteria bacterium RIFCSPHIGHO2_12_FULL_33_9]